MRNIKINFVLPRLSEEYPILLLILNSLYCMELEAGHEMKTESCKSAAATSSVFLGKETYVSKQKEEIGGKDESGRGFKSGLKIRKLLLFKTSLKKYEN